MQGTDVINQDQKAYKVKCRAKESSAFLITTSPRGGSMYGLCGYDFAPSRFLEQSRSRKTIG